MRRAALTRRTNFSATTIILLKAVAACLTRESRSEVARGTEMSFGGDEGGSETGFEPVKGGGGDLNETGRSG